MTGPISSGRASSVGDIPGPAPLRLSGRLRVWKELHDQALDAGDADKARQVFDYAIHTLAKEGR